MRFTPRAQEYNRIVEILESSEYDNAKDMAKALIKEMVEILAMRDTYAGVHVWQDGKKGVNYGPFYSEGDAEKFVQYLGGIGGKLGLVKLYSPGAMQANYEGKKGWTPWCLDPGCGHAPFTHSMAGPARGKCHLPTCPCEKYKK
ncbi:hypothetical protein SEA_YOSIF_63 [Streptomyces phage Yosif]|uniref:Uncharacterized protein n=1 Tax=Streptomyces phage Yosif TaxID=2201421 RepID=A0A2Z4QBY6_9CAUD|nr:hypothetical protein KGG71_gp63 [Streptomyces phage Yosif]AWY07627.1 hypothetical protein SEA_YOSIF_63 [Streptomyces phage Yosif]